MEWREQVCVVTGGTQGIGWAIVQAFATRGATVFACGRSLTSLNRAREEAEQVAGWAQIHLAQIDVTDRESYTGWLEEIVARTGRIDVLVNNAAFVRWTDVADMSIDDAECTMRVAFDGMVYGIKTILPHMHAAGRGHIVNIGSIAGRIFVGGSSAAYGAAKAAVDAYSQLLQVELSQSAVNVTLVRLGTVSGTDFFKKHVSESRMPPLTRFMPPLSPPQVADAIVAAIEKRRQIVTLPRYLILLSWVYQIAPRFSRWLVRQGGQRARGYAEQEWRYRR